MIGLIGPLVKRSFAQGVVSAVLYTLGAAVGASLFGLFLGMVGQGVRWLLHLGYQSNTSTVYLFIACLAFLGGVRDIGLLRFRLPQPAKQVPRHYMAVFGPETTSTSLT